MQTVHIFYKELSADENNIFKPDIAEKNEVEHVGFKKSQEYAVTGLPTNHVIGSALVRVTDVDRQNFLSEAMQKLVKEKKDPDLDPDLGLISSPKYANNLHAK